MGWKKALWPEWELVSLLGSGAYGKVYKIKREDIGGTYYAALKVVSFPLADSEIETLQNANMNEQQIAVYFDRIVQELSGEFSVMERLKGNTNIVSYEDHKIVPHRDGLGWDILIRMELLTPLTEYQKQHVFTERDVVRLGMDICNALILCEREHIIHRDIKPGNIFVSNFENYKLGDFSIAKIATRGNPDTSPRGTYTYMPPEVHSGKTYDQTIDLYSLGLILYRLMNNGRPPFAPLPPAPLTPDAVEQANKRRIDGEPLPKPANASVVMAGIILKACAFEPADRYQCAADMRRALERCMAMQGPLTASKQVAKRIKQAVDSIQEPEEHKTEPLNPKEIQNAVAAECSEEQNAKKPEDYFMKAGDL